MERYKSSRGTPKWMVHLVENPMKLDDLGESNRFIIQPNLADWFVVRSHASIKVPTPLTTDRKPVGVLCSERSTVF